MIKKNNEVVQVIDTTYIGIDKWYKVRSSENKEGWARAKYFDTID